MISLFIDTSSSDVSIAIVKDNIILGSINKSSIKEHSKHVANDIKTLLDNNSISPKEVNNIMVCVGPGSFTGIRIGVTIAKTYGYLVNNSLYPMSSLKELALSTKEKKEYIMSLISAKNNNCLSTSSSIKLYTVSLSVPNISDNNNSLPSQSIFKGS